MQPSLLRIRVWSAEDLLLAVLDRGAECNVTPTKRKAQEQAMRQRSHGYCCSRSSTTRNEPVILALKVSLCSFVWRKSSGEAVRNSTRSPHLLNAFELFGGVVRSGKNSRQARRWWKGERAQQSRMRAVDAI